MGDSHAIINKEIDNPNEPYITQIVKWTQVHPK